VNALARFEEFLEDLFEGSLTQLMRSPVQPAEIAKRLERAMELEQRASVGKILVPTQYTVLLHPDDFAALKSARGALEREMARFIVERAREREFSLLTRPRVRMQPHPKTRRRRVRVEAELSDAVEEEATSDLEWTQQLVRATLQERAPGALLHFQNALGQHQQVRLDRPEITLGRARDNDVILDDPRVSRHHARIVLRYGQFIAQDLDSTYGTYINGEPIQECILRPGDLLLLGGVELLYEET
jgi:hypothetical protein